MNPETVRTRRREGESILYGDCTRPAVLDHAGIKHARVIVVAISDPLSTRRMVQLARQLNPYVRVVVRTRYQREIAELRKLGADEVIPEEFETSVEVFGRVLRELGVSMPVIRRLTDGIRADQYAAFTAHEFGRVPLSLPPDVHAAADTDACEVKPDHAAAGKTIGELRVRKQTGASVIAIRRGRQVITNPGADMVIEAGDVVVLFGEPDQLTTARGVLGNGAGLAVPPTAARAGGPGGSAASLHFTLPCQQTTLRESGASVSSRWA